MGAVMARPARITEEQLLEAARQVFLEKGIRGTAAEVAKRAGVAQGSVFKYFKTKDELFAAAMAPGPRDPAWLVGLEARVGKGDVRQTLTEVGLEILEFFRKITPTLMMAWSNPMNQATGPNPPPLRALKRVAGFFEAEMRAGRLRRHDPEVAARAFLGSIQSYVFFEVLLTAQDELPLPAEIFVRGLTEILMNGMTPKSP
jgi:AcrR family transcriptional regulator